MDLYPKFAGKTLGEITRTELQDYLFGIVVERKMRKAEKLALMLNCIFDMANEDFALPSPMKKVVLPHFESQRGKALTRDEEQRLISRCKESGVNPEVVSIWAGHPLSGTITTTRTYSNSRFALSFIMR